MFTAILALSIAANPFGSFTGTNSRGGGSAVHRAATVGWYGDSITQGSCSGTPPPTALDALLPAGYSVQNLGIAGETAHEIYVRVRSGAATACVGEPCGHYIVQGAVNTLKSPGYAALSASAVASIALNGTGSCDTGVSDSCGTMDSVDYVHATYPNARVFVIGVLPYAGCSPVVCPSLVEPGLRARTYNADLSTACAARSWLTCVLPYSAFEDPEDPDHLSATYACEADLIHLKDAGSAEFADQVYSAASW